MEVSEQIRIQKSQPLNEKEQTLLRGYAQEIIEQGKRMDDLARQLIGVSLGIPSVLTAIFHAYNDLVFSAIEKGMMSTAFLTWVVSLICCCISLIPRKLKVDPDLFSNGSFSRKIPEVMGVEEYFYFIARHKRRWLIAACGFVCSGILIATAVVLF